jgi:Spy/CpxP family protein refolding chaperone
MHVFRATAVALVATLITATAIYAADAQPGTERAHRWESRLQQKLGLTDDQLQAIRQVYAARDANAQRQHYRALRTAQNELRRLALNGADEGALQAKQTEVQNLLAQSLQMRLQMLKQVGPILNPDQREAFAKMMDGGPRGHHHHRGERAQPQRG